MGFDRVFSMVSKIDGAWVCLWVPISDFDIEHGQDIVLWLMPSTYHKIYYYENIEVAEMVYFCV